MALEDVAAERARFGGERMIRGDNGHEPDGGEEFRLEVANAGGLRRIDSEPRHPVAQPPKSCQPRQQPQARATDPASMHQARSITHSDGYHQNLADWQSGNQPHISRNSRHRASADLGFKELDNVNNHEDNTLRCTPVRAVAGGTGAGTRIARESSDLQPVV